MTKLVLDREKTRDTLLTQFGRDMDDCTCDLCDFIIKIAVKVYQQGKDGEPMNAIFPTKEIEVESV